MKRTDLGHQRWEGSRDASRTGATARCRQEASGREDKGADTRGRDEEGVGPQQGGRTLWRESGVSGCTRRKKLKDKKAQEIREDRTQRADAMPPEAGSVPPEGGSVRREKKGFFANERNSLHTWRH